MCDVGEAYEFESDAASFGAANGDVEEAAGAFYLLLVCLCLSNCLTLYS
jgi:hypothetical protein